MVLLVGFQKDPIEVSNLYSANNTMISRGPDDEGYWFLNEHGYQIFGSGNDTNAEKKNFANYSKSNEKAKIALGHRRLSIIDLSHMGHQPMVYSNLVVAFNGEIYNFKELREQLRQDWDFISETDTEVILAAYKKWGEKCFEKLDGMWAIALYDMDKSKLFLSRDKFGEKPLYIYKKQDTIVFASEIKAILATGLCKFEPNMSSLANFIFLSTNRFHNSFRNTLAKGIKEILPATTLKIETRSMTFETIRHFKLGRDFVEAGKFSLSSARKISKMNLQNF